MRQFSGINYRYLLCILSLVQLGTTARAQHLLDVRLTTTSSRVPLQQALAGIAREGNFYFSYNSDQLPTDSLVQIPAGSHSVRALLTRWLGEGYSYKEQGRYLIIRLPGGEAAGHGDLFRGYVVNKVTGAPIADASVYETHEFASTLSDRNGYFQLRVRGARESSGVVVLNVSKARFNDTTYLVAAAPDRALRLQVSPIRSVTLDSVIVTPESALEHSWIGQLFISSKQKVRDINLSGFFVRQPFQYSLVPGLGTHGKMSAQVANKFSFNILGGYSGGVNGAEIGGLFNIDKRQVRYVQVAGLYNSVGAGVQGIQIAGLYNGVIDSVNGVGVAGLANQVGASFRGVQIAGIYNRARQPSRGVQITGGLNYVPRLEGVQIAGVANQADSAVDVQIAAIFNTVPRVTGLQIGLINIADTSSGYSLGLVNLIRHGYHKLSLYYTDALDVNLAYKGGNEKLYTMLLASASLTPGKKAYGFGFGLGKAFRLSPALSLTTELTEETVYTGSWSNLPVLARLQPALQWILAPGVSCFAGPAFCVYFREQDPEKGFGDPAPSHTIRIASRVSGWFGFQAGFNFF